MKSNEQILDDLKGAFDWAKTRNAPCKNAEFNPETFILCLNAARKIFEKIQIPRKEWTEHTLIAAASHINYEIFENKTKKYDPSVGIRIQTLEQNILEKSTAQLFEAMDTKLPKLLPVDMSDAMKKVLYGE